MITIDQLKEQISALQIAERSSWAQLEALRKEQDRALDSVRNEWHKKNHELSKAKIKLEALQEMQGEGPGKGDAITQPGPEPN